jgi:endonuclease III
VKRLSQRLGLTALDAPEKIEQDLMSLLKRKDWFRATYLLIEHGRAVCSAQRPACASCTLKGLCPSNRIT